MEFKSPMILVYITSDKDRVMGGDPLTLYITDENEKKACIKDMAFSLKAEVVQLKNGDYMLLSNG